MASQHKKHFVDPRHLLFKIQYGDASTRTCDICLLGLAGLAGYCCDDCGIRIHEACADHFDKSIDFFADRHALKLIRTPGGGDRGTHVCDLCREECPPASFVYRCDECDFDLHPLCSLLPETVESPVHPGHVLRMVTSPSVSCAACHGSLPLWHYVCSCDHNFKLHIACALDDELAAGADDHQGGHGGVDQRGFGPADHNGGYGGVDQRGFGPADHNGGYGGVDQRGFNSAGQGGGYYGNPPVTMQGFSPFFQGFMPAMAGGYGPFIPGYGPAPAAFPGYGHFIPNIYGGNPIQGYGPPFIPGGYAPAGAPAKAKPSRCSAIAKFLLKQSFDVAVGVATGGVLGSPLVDLLSAALNS